MVRGLGLREIDGVFLCQYQACSRQALTRSSQEKERDGKLGLSKIKIDQAKRKDRDRDDPLKIQIKSKRLGCGGACMAHAK